MKRRKVNSSLVASVGYTSKTETLEIEFVSGTVYQYFDVPLGTYRAFLAAESKGVFFNDEVKGLFRYNQVT